MQRHHRTSIGGSMTRLSSSHGVRLLIGLLSLLCIIAGQSSASSAATHGGLRQLTASNFTLTQHGAWLIEFFSPACIHCKKFGPTWSELSQNKEPLRTLYPEAPFTLAQVNCMAQRDLCTDQGVEFLPRLTIYEDGVQHQGEYKHERNYAEISAYIDKHAAEYRAKKGVADRSATPSAAAPATVKSAAATPPAAAHPSVAASAGPPVVAQPQSSPLVPVVPAAPVQPTDSPQDQLPAGPNPKGELLSYGGPLIKTPEELAQWLDKGSGQGPTFVKFYAPWCPHCKAMAAAFERVADSLKGKVNVLQVDCEANKALCNSYKVHGYPTIRMYNDGVQIEYNGGRNHDAMLQWASKAGSTAGLRSLDSSAALNKVAKADEVFFLYLHSPATTKREIDIIDQATKVLAGSEAAAYISSAPELLVRYVEYLGRDGDTTIPSTSALLVFKDHSAMQPTAAYHPSSMLRTSLSEAQSVEAVSKWIYAEQWPLVTELTGSNMKEVLENETGAYVAIAALSDIHHHEEQMTDATAGTKERDRELMALRGLSLAWRESQAERSSAKVIWAWIDADRWATQLRKLYTIKPSSLPRLLLIDGGREEYFELPSQKPDGFGTWLTKETVFERIEAAATGQTKAKSSRSMFDRGVRGAAAGTGAVIDTSKQHPLSSLGFFVFCMAILFWVLRRASADGPAAGLPLYAKGPAGVKAD